MNRALDNRRVRKHLEQDAFEIKAMTPAEVTQLFRSEMDKWVPAIRQALKIN